MEKDKAPGSGSTLQAPVPLMIRFGGRLGLCPVCRVGPPVARLPGVGPYGGYGAWLLL